MLTGMKLEILTEEKPDSVSSEINALLDSADSESLKNDILKRIKTATNIEALDAAYDFAAENHFLKASKEKQAEKIYHALISKASELNAHEKSYTWFVEAGEKSLLLSDTCELMARIMAKIMATQKNVAKKLARIYTLTNMNTLDTPQFNLRMIYAFAASGNHEAALSLYYKKEVATALTKAELEDGVHHDNVHISILYMLLGHTASAENRLAKLPKYREIADLAYLRLMASETPFDNEKIQALMMKIVEAYPLPSPCTQQSQGRITAALETARRESDHIAFGALEGQLHHNVAMKKYHENCPGFMNAPVRTETPPPVVQPLPTTPSVSEPIMLFPSGGTGTKPQNHRPHLDQRRRSEPRQQPAPRGRR